MELIKLGWPWGWLYNLAGRISGKKHRRVRVIGGADGPTAIFVARGNIRGGGRPRRREGILAFHMNWAELFLAAKLAAGIVGALMLLAAALYNSSGRKRHL